MNRSAAAAVLSSLLVVLTAACGEEAAGDGDPGTTTTAVASPSPNLPPSTVPTTSTTQTPVSLPSTTVPAPSEYPVLPVGPGGIEYRGGGGDIEVAGPHLMAVGPDGTIFVVDPVGPRILAFGSGEGVIDLSALDILSVTAFSSSADSLVVVEVWFAPARQRVHRMTFDGTLIDSVDIPAGARLEDGLSGVTVDDAGDIALVLEGGARYAIAPPGSNDFAVTDTIVSGGYRVRQVAPDLLVDQTLITADLIGALGGLSLLGVAEDGTIVVVREEVVTMSPAIEVLQTVEWYRLDGTFVGSARVDLRGQAISTPPGVALAGNSTVLQLSAGARAVTVSALIPTGVRIVAGS